MRLLIVNPNTSPGVTARIDGAAQAVAHPGDRFTTVPAAFGPSLIVTEEDGRAAVAGVLAAIAQHEGDFDGIVLASFGDTGAPEVRAAHAHLPVIGIAEAAFAEVRRRGGPFAIVTFAPEVAAPLHHKSHEHGVLDQLVGIVSPPGPLRHDPADVADSLGLAILDLCRACAVDGAQSVVLGGGPLAGLAHRLQDRCPIPVIDGTQAAVRQLRDACGN